VKPRKINKMNKWKVTDDEEEEEEENGGKQAKEIIFGGVEGFLLN
jgi:hypothetical protein